MHVRMTQSQLTNGTGHSEGLGFRFGAKFRVCGVGCAPPADSTSPGSCRKGDGLLRFRGRV